MCGTKQYNTIYKLDGVAPSEKQQYCYCPKLGKACMDKHTVETEKQNTPLICEGWQSAPPGGGSLFAPTSRSWMSNIFRDSESLGKSNGKNWSHI